MTVDLAATAVGAPPTAKTRWLRVKPDTVGAHPFAQLSNFAINRIQTCQAMLMVGGLEDILVQQDRSRIKNRLTIFI